MNQTPLSLPDISPKGENIRWNLLSINKITWIFPLLGGIKGGLGDQNDAFTILATLSERPRV